MRRRLAGLVLALALGAGAGGALAPGAAAQTTPDLQAFCQARASLEQVFGEGNNTAIKDALDTLKASAPTEVATDVTLIADTLAKKGEKAFANKKFRAAIERADTFVLASCGFPEVDVIGTDYEFQGIPDTIPAGTTAFKFTDDAPKEHHELVLVREKPGVNLSAKQLLKLPEKKLQKKADFVGSSEADPGHFQVSVTNLTPGHYVAVCNLPVGGKKHGKPHWKLGMLADFEVAAT